MIDIKSLLGMIATEAIEQETDAPKKSRENNPDDNLPPIRYRLELIRKGKKLYWME